MNAHSTIFGAPDTANQAANGTKQAVSLFDTAVERCGDVHRRVIETCDEAIRIIGCNADMAIRGYEADLTEAETLFAKERDRLRRLIAQTKAERTAKLVEQEKLKAASEAALAVLSETPATAAKKTLPRGGDVLLKAAE